MQAASIQQDTGSNPLMPSIAILYHEIQEHNVGSPTEGHVGLKIYCTHTLSNFRISNSCDVLNQIPKGFPQTLIEAFNLDAGRGITSSTPCGDPPLMGRAPGQERKEITAKRLILSSSTLAQEQNRPLQGKRERNKQTKFLCLTLPQTSNSFHFSSGERGGDKGRGCSNLSTDSRR
ncbi:hypothetical protein CEXT_603881 [Caerostris extrusa]|uniref:Uncharacterized protein n=1 Tax=Caerostris extrusa TaxID=172846 RepID=A0AAV4SZA8_CAEEX|nr:hypothetical protein CEXT_603881 [Caerostris extrusa]